LNVRLELDGKRALVTGSSSGIGRAIAKMLAAEGASIVVHGRDPGRTHAVAAEILAADGQAVPVIGDLATDSSAAQVAAQATAAYGGIDILVNNAGGRATGGAKVGMFQLTMDQWLQTYEMNFMSSVRLITALVPAMIQNGWGRVINISSLAGQAPSGAMGDYGAAKAAVANLTFNLARSLARTGVTANTVSPGMIRTAAFEDVLTNVAARQGFGADKDKAVKWMIENTLRQTVARLGQPDDIAFIVTTIASPRSDFVTGANIRVDGGAAPAIN
jgi:3-oxoacyl-[acyl-carrier protein] reductase